MKHLHHPLVESVTFQLVTSSVDHASLVVPLLDEYNGATACELVVVASALQAVAIIHQASHWTASGDPFHGDHLLFERVYNPIPEQVDRLVEKAVGLGGGELVSPVVMMQHAAMFASVMASVGFRMPNSSELARRSFEAEMHFMGFADALLASFATAGGMTLGVENMLGEIMDQHEKSVYLLKQRVTG